MFSQSVQENREWWLPYRVWRTMSVSERREHCYNVNAYFRSQARKARGEAPNDLQDRILAEAEIDARIRLRPSIIYAM